MPRLPLGRDNDIPEEGADSVKLRERISRASKQQIADWYGETSPTERILSVIRLWLREQDARNVDGDPFEPEELYPTVKKEMTV